MHATTTAANSRPRLKRLIERLDSDEVPFTVGERSGGDASAAGAFSVSRFTSAFSSADEVCTSSGGTARFRPSRRKPQSNGARPSWTNLRMVDRLADSQFRTFGR